MLNIGVIGIGFMGRAHLENYLRLEREGLPIRVQALCDIDPAKLSGEQAAGNIDTGASSIDWKRFAKYGSVADMLAGEKLDMVDIALPTYLHKPVSVQCLEAGVHVLCEKPMALNREECDAMIAAASAHDRKLMIGQCLRFWPAYEYLKQLIEDGTYGQARGGYFYRGSGTPDWGPWLMDKAKSGAAMLDMHVHDTDMVQWLFGMPEAVSSHARNVIPGSGYDIVSTHYKYPDGKVVNAQVDWTLQGDYGFEMTFRVNFERASVVFAGDVLKVNPTGEKGFEPELPEDMGYYFEQKYFINALLKERRIEVCTPESARASIALIEAEIESADQDGSWVNVRP